MTPGARRLLARSGWCFVPPEKAAALRESPRDMILRPRLIEALRRHRFEYRGEWHPLSGSGIEQVVRELQSVGRAHSLLQANERFYRLLTLGVTVTEFMPDGRKHAPTVPLIDWAHPEANHWDMMEAPPLHAQGGGEAPSPSAVGWVNGLPLVLIESAPAPNRRVDEAIERHVRHQRRPDLLPLYAHAHLLLALGQDGARYGTTGTPRRLWARWREPGTRVEPAEEALHLLGALLAPTRLLDLLRHFVLFDRRLGKVVARHPQYFGVHAMLERVQQRRHDGAREGGVVWHTTGAGKSLTMVFLTRALMLHPATQTCRVLVVTDRVDLEEQLARNFIDGGAFGASAGLALRKEGERARVRSGRELARRIAQGNERLLFTLVHKFLTAARLPEGYNPSADLVVLVDEGHRSQSGEAHARMRRALPRAAFLAFTGTPLLAHDQTEQRFGPVLHAHTLQQAVDDGMVVPLLYEEREPGLGIDEAAVDRWFERTAAGLSPAGRSALQRRLTRQRNLHGATGRIELIAQDIAEHFHRHFKSTGLGLKGQVATASKRDAIRYQRLLDATGLVRSAVVISPPDVREGEDADDHGGQAEVRRWWARHVGRQPELRDAQVLRDFSGDGGPDLLIVVDRLLTGFDEPRNAVLYIDKPLSGHNLLQAVARVNRLHDAKAHGLVVDYRGILRALDAALRGYEALAARVPGVPRPDHGAPPAADPGPVSTPGGTTPRAPSPDGAPAQAWQVLLDEAVQGILVREPDALYRIGPPMPHAEAAPAPGPARATAAQALAVDPPLRHGLVLPATAPPGLPASALLRQALALGEAQGEGVALPPAGPTTRHGNADVLARALTDEPLARQCLDICCGVLGQDVIDRAPAETWVRLARTMQQAIEQGWGEHSLVTQNRVAAIRQALLPPLHALIGLDRARQVIEQAVGLAR